MTAAALTQSRELWYLMRGSGLVALILLTLTMIGGKLDDEVTHARRAVSACPALALRLVQCREQPRPRRGSHR